MPAGTIPYSAFPSPIPAGLFEAVETALSAAGFVPRCDRAPDGLHVSDMGTATTALSNYAGSAAQLAFVKTQKQTALDAVFDANFDLSKFIRGGASTNITAANVGTFLATITNNYRSLRASISGAANVSAVNAININSGWPANP